MVFLIILIIIFVIFYLIVRHTKRLKLPNVSLITGAVKTGKTTLAVCLSIKEHKRALKSWKIDSFFRKLFKKPLREKPLLYSNIPLMTYEYVPLTRDILLRNVRVNYKSVILISEASLVADSMAYKDQDINEILTLFFKLIGHETHGGKVILDTQSMSDNHFAIKRCINQFIWIHSNSKIPFFIKMQVREMLYNSDNQTSNNFDSDIENSTLTLWVRKKWWRYFDCYCYSSFTDDLPIENNVIKLCKNDSLKAIDIVQVREFKHLKGGVNDDLEKN